MISKDKLIPKRERPDDSAVFAEIKRYLEQKLPGSTRISDLENIAAGLTAEISAAWDSQISAPLV